MGKLNTYTVYHATDKINVASIINDNFLFKENDTHWLGNGVYFFLDKNLAISWGNDCPTRKYGSIRTPAIIEAVICVDDDSVCDMRELQKYNKVKSAFDVFWHAAHTVPCKIKHDKYCFAKMECAFFDWLAKQFDLNCIICNFKKRELPIVKSKKSDIFKMFRVTYVETQMCVKDVAFILERREIS